MFTHGVNMLRQNVNITVMLISPCSAHARIIVKARVGVKTHGGMRSETGESCISDCEQIKENKNVPDENDSLAAAKNSGH